MRAARLVACWGLMGLAVRYSFVAVNLGLYGVRTLKAVCAHPASFNPIGSFAPGLLPWSVLIAPICTNARGDARLVEATKSPQTSCFLLNLNTAPDWLSREARLS